MIRTIAVAAVALTLTAAIPAPPAAAQHEVLGGALMGGLFGAGIGAAIGGRRGAAVGAGVGVFTGAMMGAQAERSHYAGGYFWHRGRCLYEYPSGELIRVARGNCH
jgi:uncharacterized membrane protein